jgi:hypothetical protein
MASGRQVITIGQGETAIWSVWPFEKAGMCLRIFSGRGQKHYRCIRRNATQTGAQDNAVLGQLLEAT